MKSTFYTITYVYLIVFGSILTVYSIPAIRQPIEITQPDGTKLTILLKGDEFLHYAQSTDGYVLKQNVEGYYTYANKDSKGNFISGNVIARNVIDRDNTEANFLKNLKTGASFSDITLNNALQKRMSSASVKRSMLRSSSALPPGLISDYPRTGSPKSLVILVNFSDVAFNTADNNTAFNDMLNKVGYNLNGHVGSVRDFYTFNSGGLFTPNYEVVGPVTISKPMAYYGANDSIGNDLRPASMIYEACLKADNLVNYADFDYDNDGYVDNIYVYYAGKGEADGGGANTIWPHSWGLSGAGLSLTLDGKKINAYACSGELDGRSGEMSGMGTFTHEYSHILGLPDMYDVDYDKYNGEGFDLNYWSLMAYGAYNNNSCTPPCLTLPERTLLGWTTPINLDESKDVVLTDLGSTNNGYKVSASSSGEYFLIENRQQIMNVWDRYIPWHGMLVYHMDLRDNRDISVNYWGTTYRFFMNEMWSNNMVNALAIHQCCDIEEADNVRLFFNGSNSEDYFNNIKGDPFPGNTGVHEFTDKTAPAFSPWNSTSFIKEITNITETDGVIRFSFVDPSDYTKAPNALVAKDIEPFSFTARWNSFLNATGYYLDVYTLDKSKSIVEKKYITGFHNQLVLDTVISINVEKDLTTYYYQVRATKNNTVFTPTSDSIALTTISAAPMVLQATLVDHYSFRANWQRANYATGYYLDVFTINSLSGDTTWVDGYHNFYLTKNYETISELEDQTPYNYQVRATNGIMISRNSSVKSLTTTKASEILAYVKDRIICLKGIDKGSKVTIYNPNGTIEYSLNVSQIQVKRRGIYLITALFNGQEKHLKLFVQ